MVRDLQAHLWLGTKQEKRQVRGKLRTNKEVDRTEGIGFAGFEGQVGLKADANHIPGH